MDCRWEGCSEWPLGVDPWWVTSLTADAVGFIHAALTIPVALRSSRLTELLQVPVLMAAAESGRQAVPAHPSLHHHQG